MRSHSNNDYSILLVTELYFDAGIVGTDFPCCGAV